MANDKYSSNTNIRFLDYGFLVNPSEYSSKCSDKKENNLEGKLN